MASKRINDPEVAENILAWGDADLVSMARPLLVDADFIAKTRAGRGNEINTCIDCNQGYLDTVFSGRLTGCLVNPRACRETELQIEPASNRRRIAVIGAGPGGLATAVTAAERGHEDLDRSNERDHFAATWCIDYEVTAPGGLMQPQTPKPARQVWLLQRKEEALGKRLGKTTGWIRPALMGRRSVHMWAGVEYHRIEQQDNALVLHLSVHGEARALEVDTIVVCAGQDSENELLPALQEAGLNVTPIGGARLASELDATRAIDEGMRVAARL